MRNEQLNVVRGDVNRDRNIDPPSLRKGGKCHVRALIGHRGTNWKRRISKGAPKHVCFVFYICVAPQRLQGSFCCRSPRTGCSGRGFPLLRLEDRKRTLFMYYPAPAADDFSLRVQVFQICSLFGRWEQHATTGP